MKIEIAIEIEIENEILYCGYAFLDTTISANKTVSNRDNRGGAIYNNTGSVLTVSNSTLSGNSAVYAGGGIGLSWYHAKINALNGTSNYN